MRGGRPSGGRGHDHGKENRAIKMAGAIGTVEVTGSAGQCGSVGVGPTASFQVMPPLVVAQLSKLA